LFGNEKWQQVIESTFEQVRMLGKVKGREYSGEIDRLLNFRRLGDRFDLPMEVILAVYATKHWDSIQTYIRDMNLHGANYLTSIEYRKNQSEPIGGRIDDLITYLLLLKCMVQERYDNAANDAGKQASDTRDATSEEIRDALADHIATQGTPAIQGG
jgi:hypothetical protein